MMRLILTIPISLLAVQAFAEDAKPAAADQQPAAQIEEKAEKPAQAEEKSAKPEHAEHKPAKPANDAKPKATAHAPADAQKPHAAAAQHISHSKFLGLLYSEIAKRTPRDYKAGPGAVSATFRVNSSGKIDNVVIKETTSAEHAAVVKKILANVQAPPPPNGTYEASQSFKFH
jgi:hypothetical protein